MEKANDDDLNNGTCRICGTAIGSKGKRGWAKFKILEIRENEIVYGLGWSEFGGWPNIPNNYHFFCLKCIDPDDSYIERSPGPKFGTMTIKF